MRVPSRRFVRLIVISATLTLCAIGALAQSSATLSADDQKAIDEIAAKTLAATGAPSASIAIVKNGQIIFARAYGKASLEPAKPADPQMRYAIGSISKQFTATAILLLQQRGKLSLDDPVSKFVPNVTRAKEVTIRELLSQTSGYQDYWPQDYVPPDMLKPVTAEQILDRWARIPLDFEPGTKWQYSNTNFVLAGLIVQKASGMPFMRFLSENIFKPLKMSSVYDVNEEKLEQTDAQGYLRYALGPLRPAPKEGKGWLFAMAELAMTSSDLARWDISVMDQAVLKPASYRALETQVLLKNGVSSGYALGMFVRQRDGRRELEHDGEVSGFTAENVVFPDDRAAIVVLTNMDATSASSQIAEKIIPILFPDQDKDKSERLALARRIFEGLQHGQLDRSLLTANCSSYFGEQAVQDFAASLGPLGAPSEFTQIRHSLRGGMGFRAYSIKFAKGQVVRLTVRDMPDGKIEQLQVAAQ